VGQTAIERVHRIAIDVPPPSNSLRTFGVAFERLTPDFYCTQENAAVRDLFSIDRIGQLPSHSPIVLYGLNGVGKTALGYSLANRWEKTQSNGKPMHLTGSDFLRQFAGAIESDDMSRFRERMRTASSLMIDSLADLCNKLSAQDELVHVIDAMLEIEKPVLVTCVELPQSIRGLRRSLVSRLSGGVSVEVHPPSHSAINLAIDYWHKNSTKRLSPAEQLKFVDSLPEGTVLPAVRGILNAYVSVRREKKSDQLKDQPLLDTIEAVNVESNSDRKLIDDLIKTHSARPTIRASQIAKAVSRHTGCLLSEMRGAGRQSHIVKARAMAMYLCRIVSEMPYQKIGEYFGNRDHTTAMHSIHKIEKSIEQDLELTRLRNDVVRDLQTIAKKSS
jgi:chromosomal replication initiator protein